MKLHHPVFSLILGALLLTGQAHGLPATKKLKASCHADAYFQAYHGFLSPSGAPVTAGTLEPTYTKVYEFNDRADYERSHKSKVCADPDQIRKHRRGLEFLNRRDQEHGVSWTFRHNNDFTRPDACVVTCKILP